jgi:hypothetical protein
MTKTLGHQKEVFNKQEALARFKPSNNNRHFSLFTLKWMSVYIAIGFIAALLLPFPASLIGAIGGFMLLNFLRTRLMLKKMGD